MFSKKNAFCSKDKKIQKMLDLLQKWEYSYNTFLSILHSIGEFDEKINVGDITDNVKERLRGISFKDSYWLYVNDTFLEIKDKNGKTFYLKIISMEFPRDKGKQNPQRTEYCLYEELEDGIIKIYNNQSIKTKKDNQSVKTSIVPAYILCLSENISLIIETNGLCNGGNSLNYTIKPTNSDLTFTANISDIENSHYQELYELLKKSKEVINFEYLFNLIKKIINIDEAKEATFSVKKGAKLSVKMKFNNGVLKGFLSNDSIDNGNIRLSFDNNTGITERIQTERKHSLDSTEYTNPSDNSKVYIEFIKRMACK